MGLTARHTLHYITCHYITGNYRSSQVIALHQIASHCTDGMIAVKPVCSAETVLRCVCNCACSVRLSLCTFACTVTRQHYVVPLYHGYTQLLHPSGVVSESPSKVAKTSQSDWYPGATQRFTHEQHTAVRAQPGVHRDAD